MQRFSIPSDFDQTKPLSAQHNNSTQSNKSIVYLSSHNSLLEVILLASEFKTLKNRLNVTHDHLNKDVLSCGKEISKQQNIFYDEDTFQRIWEYCEANPKDFILKNNTSVSKGITIMLLQEVLGSSLDSKIPTIIHETISQFTHCAPHATAKNKLTAKQYISNIVQHGFNELNLKNKLFGHSFNRSQMFLYRHIGLIAYIQNSISSIRNQWQTQKHQIMHKHQELIKTFLETSPFTTVIAYLNKLCGLIPS
ncbi:TPA: hypothetical protein ACX6S4_003007 [Photobacterium damselae]